MLKSSVRYLVLGALFLIPFLPLYIANSLFFPFITGKHFIFRILVEIAVLGWGILALLDTKYRPRFSWTLVLYGALVAWMFIADLFAVNAHKAFWSNYERMDGWVTLIHVFLFFVVSGAVLGAEKAWKRWWLTFVGASAFVCLYGFLQLAGLFTINQGGVRVDATMGNAAYLAAYLLFVIAIAVWQAIESRGWLRWSLGILAVLQTMLLFYTATRGALLGIVGAGILGALLYMFETKGKARKAGIAVLAGIVLLVGGFFLVKDTEWARSEPTLARLSSITLADGATRLTLWNMAFHGMLERPVTGWGHEGFNYIFNKNYVPTLYAQEPWFDRAHNIFVDWLVAGGIPAFLLFLSLLASGVLALFRKGSKTERVVLISLMAAYAFQGLFVFDNLFSYVPLAALLAFAHLLVARPIEKLESLPTIEEAQVGTAVIPVAAVIGVVVVWVVNIPSMQAGNDLIAALTPNADPRVNQAAFERAISRGSFASQEIREQMVTYAGNIANQQNIPNDIRDAFAREAVSEIGKEVERAPLDARLRLEYSYAYRALGDFVNAKKELAIAQSLSPQKQTLIVEEGVLALQAKDYPAARAAFTRAFELNTSFPELAAYAAAGEVVAGNKEKGKALLTEYFGTTTVSNGILILAYYELKDYKELIPILEKRVSETPDDATALFQLATVHAESGDKVEAVRLVRAFIEQHKQYVNQGTQFITSLNAAP